MNQHKDLPRSCCLPLSKDLPLSKLLHILLAGAAICAISLSLVHGQSAPSPREAPSAETAGRDLAAEMRVFDLVNDERKKLGIQPLVWNDKAASAARSHSDDMAGSDYLSHSDLFGGKPDDRVAKAGLTDWRRLGENIAWVSGHADPLTRVVECWMNSRGHRENMLNPKFRESGLGMTVTSDGKSYFTQVFVSR